MSTNRCTGSNHFCKCGCGIEITSWTDYYVGHYTRTPEINAKSSESITEALGKPEARESMSRSSRNRWDSTEGLGERTATGKRMSEFLSGRPKTPEHVENQRQSQEVFWESSEGHKTALTRAAEIVENREDYNGEGNPNWRGGEKLRLSTSDPDRDSIRHRDNYTCQGCGSKSSLETHHIDEDPMNDDVTNKITTCHDCNMEASRKDTREYWFNFYTSKIKEKGTY